MLWDSISGGWQVINPLEVLTIRPRSIIVRRLNCRDFYS